MNRSSITCLLAAGFFGVTGTLGAPRAAIASAAPMTDAQEHDHGAPPTEKLGTVSFATSCAAATQPGFNRAVALLHSFAFKAATEAFNQSLKTDPTCAIADWGIALAAWGNPFAIGIKPDAQLARGLEAVQRGRALAAKTQREKDYIDAAGKLFDDFHTLDQRTRMLAYRDSMAALAARYPDDTEASIFYALSLAFSADPADKIYASQLKAGAILEKLWITQPDHPGIAHYIIHAYDYPALAPRALAAARSYAKIAPSAPHALHMPAHTFTRLGLWQESIETNIASAAAARKEGSTSEELHATDYMMYAYLQTGQDRAALGLLKSLPEIAGRFDPASTAGPAPSAAGFFAIAALPARYALEHGAWKDAAALEVNKSPYAYTEAMTQFARALGGARSGNPAIAETSIAALAQLRDQLAQQHESYWSEQVDIQRGSAAAWLALAQGKKEDAVRLMREAAAREDATEKSAITPGPLAPARELLGEMLLDLKQPAQALKEFEKTLVNEPNRFRTLSGAAASAIAAGDAVAGRRYYEQLLSICERADHPGRPELAEARRVVSAAR